jgi:alkylhydroperoxidase family enzyme
MRVKGIFKPSDYPRATEEGATGDIDTLFSSLFPGVDNPQIDMNHCGLAIAAHNPQLALHLARLSRFIALETGWCERTDLRELAIQSVNLHFRSDYGFRTRVDAAQAAGIGMDQLAALPFWQTSPLFDEEQRLVIAYSHAVVAGDVPAALFRRIVAAYGEKGAVECTSVIAFWSFWAMMLNAMGPGLDSEG